MDPRTPFALAMAILALWKALSMIKETKRTTWLGALIRTGNLLVCSQIGTVAIFKNEWLLPFGLTCSVLQLLDLWVRFKTEERRPPHVAFTAVVSLLVMAGCAVFYLFSSHPLAHYLAAVVMAQFVAQRSIYLGRTAGSWWSQWRNIRELNTAMPRENLAAVRRTDNYKGMVRLFAGITFTLANTIAQRLLIFG